MVQTYKDLIVWKKAYAVARNVYKATDTFPSSEKYSLADQMRRAAISIPSNIAEGYGRGKSQDYLRFFGIARGSCNEIETQLLLAKDFGYLDVKDFEDI